MSFVIDKPRLDLTGTDQRLPGVILPGEPGYRQCNRCIMDTTDPEIRFESDGQCHHCRSYEHRSRVELFAEQDGDLALRQVVETIRHAGRGKEYDCIIGVSGGVDSSYVAYKVRELGLRPLAVHLDNGWNSELAVANIEQVVTTLGIDLDTHVVDWEEFRDLHVAFLKASVANSEVPTDHAIQALMYRSAVKHGVGYIVSGGNLATESIMPGSWLYDNRDLRHLRDVHRRFGQRPLKTLPRYSLSQLAYWTFLKGIRTVKILNYLPYVKHRALEILERELGWRNYGGKHYESVYTKWFQAYLLPTKFKIDKRLAHYSSLICSNQMTRAEALQCLSQPLYDPEELMRDTEFVLKKLRLSPGEFREILTAPIRSYRDYKSNAHVLAGMPRLMAFAKRAAVYRPQRAA